MRSEKYIIQCRDMRSVDTIVVDNSMSLLDWLNRYMAQFGPVDLLYRVL